MCQKYASMVHQGKKDVLLEINPALLLCPLKKRKKGHFNYSIL